MKRYYVYFILAFFLISTFVFSIGGHGECGLLSESRMISASEIEDPSIVNNRIIVKLKVQQLGYYYLILSFKVMKNKYL
jgi:hypothetical protein